MNTQSIQAIPAVWMRGGTSKGIFFRAKDLPPQGPELDDLLLRIMGSPDSLQIDGVGGTTSSTSKVVIVEDPQPDGTIPYWFAQVGVDAPIVDWRGNCGNLTTAVAPFAVDEGLTAIHSSYTGDATVKLFNRNTGARIRVHLPIESGVPATHGDTQVAGVPGTGAAITTWYLDPVGTQTGQLLPLGSPMQLLTTEAGAYPVSLVDATNPYLFVARSNIPGADRPVDELRRDRTFLERIEKIRAASSVTLGVAQTVGEARTDTPTTPRVVLVEPGTGEADINAITISLQKVHRGIPMTGALCLAAAAVTPGTIPAMQLSRDPHLRPATSPGTRSLTVRHPAGLTSVEAESVGGEILSLGVTRTARRLMRGEVYPRLGSFERV